MQHTKLLRNGYRVFQPWTLTPIYSILLFHRKLCLYSWYSESQPRSQSAPPPHSGLCQNSSGQNDLKAIYEIWIIPCWGRKYLEIFCCVCDKHSGWETDDCLWDSKGMRSHYQYNMFTMHSSANTHAEQIVQISRPKTDAKVSWPLKRNSRGYLMLVI